MIRSKRLHRKKAKTQQSSWVRRQRHSGRTPTQTLSPRRGGHHWPCVLSPKLYAWHLEGITELEAGPQAPLSTLAEEAFEVCTKGDLRKEARKGKRLRKETWLLAALIHPPPPGDPGGSRRLERPPRRRRGPGAGKVLRAPGGCWRGHPDWPSSNLLDENAPHTDRWGWSAWRAPDPTWSILITPAEPRALAGRRTEFPADAALFWRGQPASSPAMTGADGWPKGRCFTSPLACGIRSIITSYSSVHTKLCPTLWSHGL